MNSGTVLTGTDGLISMTGHAHNARNRRNVAHEIEIELVVKCRCDRAGRARQQDRVAVGGRAYDRLGTDIAAGTRPILDHERLAEPLRKPLPHQAREDVIRTAGSKADDDAHRSRWIGL